MTKWTSPSSSKDATRLATSTFAGRLKPAVLPQAHLARLFPLSDDAGIERALRLIKDENPLFRQAIQILVYGVIDEPFNDLDCRNLIERLALKSLSKTEIEVLGVTEKAVFHEIAREE